MELFGNIHTQKKESKLIMVKNMTQALSFFGLPFNRGFMNEGIFLHGIAKDNRGNRLQMCETYFH